MDRGELSLSPLQTEGKLLSQLICYVLGHSKVGRSLLECFVKHALHNEPFASSSFGLTVARYSTTVLLASGRCWIEEATLLDTGRAIIKTIQLAIFLHAACDAWGNALITFFTPFDLASHEEKSFRTPDHLSAFRGGVWARD